MKFYSEKIGKIFNTVEELEAAEAKVADKEAKSKATKEKYFKCIDNIAKNLNTIIDIDKTTELSEEDTKEVIDYLFSKIPSFFSVFPKIRLI